MHQAVSISETDPSGARAFAPDAPTTTAPLDVIVRAAEAGNVEAMNLLGVLYILGLEVPRDYSKALHWYQKAIDGGSTNAMNNVAMLYLLGIGVPRDHANAAALFKRSAMRGSVQGMYSFAEMADRGMGISRDTRLAHGMYRSAAEAGYTPAMVRVSDDHARGHGARRDLVEAYAWLEVALQMGLPDELQIAALSRIDDLALRLSPKRREEARLRAAHLAAVVQMRGRTNPSSIANTRSSACLHQEVLVTETARLRDSTAVTPRLLQGTRRRTTMTGHTMTVHAAGLLRGRHDRLT